MTDLYMKRFYTLCAHYGCINVYSVYGFLRYFDIITYTIYVLCACMHILSTYILVYTLKMRLL